MYLERIGSTVTNLWAYSVSDGSHINFCAFKFCFRLLTSSSTMNVLFPQRILSRAPILYSDNIVSIMHVTSV